MEMADTHTCAYPGLGRHRRRPHHQGCWRGEERFRCHLWPDPHLFGEVLDVWRAAVIGNLRRMSARGVQHRFACEVSASEAEGKVSSMIRNRKGI